jgi:hypothetical protein
VKSKRKRIIELHIAESELKPKEIAERLGDVSSRYVSTVLWGYQNPERNKKMRSLIMKRWRKANPIKTRESYRKWVKNNPDAPKFYRKRYYALGRTNLSNHYQRWTIEHDRYVLRDGFAGTDHELARLIGRSVKAIHVRRVRLGKKRVVEAQHRQVENMAVI